MNSQRSSHISNFNKYFEQDNEPIVFTQSKIGKDDAERKSNYDSYFNQNTSKVNQQSQIKSKFNQDHGSNLMNSGRKSNKREEEDYSPGLGRKSYQEQEEDIIQSNPGNKKHEVIVKSNFEQSNDQKTTSKAVEASKEVLKSMNLSTFKELKKNNDPAIKSLVMNSKIINHLGHKIIKTSQFEEILESCKNWNKKYTDNEFPPNETSLVNNWDLLPESQRNKWKKFVWRRSSEIFGPDYNIFYQEIEPNDIKQGQLGDCYLLSSLSSLAERPHVVQKIFNPTEKNEFGVYSVWLNVNGIWKNIVIDDYFPCLSDKSGPAFSRANGNELWVLIIEKAYAKIFGSYFAIEGGNPAAALRDLTGAPYENKDEGTVNEMWQYIQTNDKQGNKEKNKVAIVINISKGSY